jgi:acyl-CoA-binding protein
MSNLEDKFLNACEKIKTVDNLDNSEMLMLYGLYKQALFNNCEEPPPSFLSSNKIKLKHKAWMDNYDMDKTTAMKMYIYTVDKLLKNKT